MPESKPTVYIETTIPSYYFETRLAPEAQAWRAATRQWWRLDRPRYRLVISEAVLAELRLGPPVKARRALRLLWNIPVLEDPPNLNDIAEYYIRHRLMPSGAGGDAVHLAIASLHKIDFLLTWNCRHLANANKISHLRTLNARLGLPVPVITTPLNLIWEHRP